MAELTDNASTPDCIFGTKAGSNNCKSDATMSAGASPLNPLLYVRYKDHVIYKNILQPNPEAIERETVGWLTHQNQDIILIEHDRTIQRQDISSGKSNGIIILKSCILEIRPLQKNSKWKLNCRQPIVKDEYAFRTSERKTHRAKSSKGEN